MRLTGRLFGPRGEYVEQDFELPDDHPVARAIREQAIDDVSIEEP